MNKPRINRQIRLLQPDQEVSRAEINVADKTAETAEETHPISTSPTTEGKSVPEVAGAFGEEGENVERKAEINAVRFGRYGENCHQRFFGYGNDAKRINGRADRENQNKKKQPKRQLVKQLFSSQMRGCFSSNMKTDCAFL